MVAGNADARGSQPQASRTTDKEVIRRDQHISHGSAVKVLPADILELRAWLVWKYVQKDSELKPRKVPYYVSGGPRRGVQGSPEDRAKLATYAEAQARVDCGGMTGVGLAMLPEWGLVALDFDGCIVDGAIDPDVLALCDGTYAERSPSKRGVRALYRGELADRKTPGFEVFHAKGFVTITGDLIDPEAFELAGPYVVELTDTVRDYYTERFGRVESDRSPPADRPEPTGDIERVRELLKEWDPGCSEPEWFDILAAIHWETRGSAEGLELADEWSKGGSNYTGRRAVEARWKRFRIDHDDPRTLASLRKEEPGSLDDIDDVSEKPARFTPIPAHQFASGTPPAWIVGGLVPEAELVVIYGESGSGKTFFITDLAVAVALGRPWRDRKVRQGSVVYVCAEGVGGFRQRLKAIARQADIALADLPLSVVADAPNLLEPKDVKAVAGAIKKAGPVQLIVIDTLSAVTPGANENAGEDMGKAVAHCKALHRLTGAVVVLIHHSGKDAAKGARGWSGLRAAADAEIEVSRMGDSRMAMVTKMKDGDDGGVFGFKLLSVVTGLDADGQELTSCVVEHCEATQPSKARSPKGVNEKIVLQAVKEEMSLGEHVVTVERVLSSAVKLLTADPNGRDRRRDLVRKAIESLSASGFVVLAENHISLPH